MLFVHPTPVFFLISFVKQDFKTGVHGAVLLPALCRLPMAPMGSWGPGAGGSLDPEGEITSTRQGPASLGGVKVNRRMPQSQLTGMAGSLAVWRWRLEFAVLYQRADLTFVDQISSCGIVVLNC